MDGKVKLFDVEGIHLLGNFDYGNVIGLDDEGYDYIVNKDSTCDKKKAEEIEQAMTELKFYEKREEKKLDVAYLHVLDACNLHCVGCYSFVSDRNKIQAMSTDQVKRLINQLHKSGVEEIVISGGEPFLRNDMTELLRYAKEDCHIAKMSVISNGTMEWDRYESAIPYMDQLNISIDGYDENTSFIRDKGIMPKVLATVNHLKDKVSLNMIVTLHKKNMAYMREYNELSKRIGVRFSFSIFTVDEANPLFKDYVMSDTDLKEIEKTLMDLNIDAAISDVPIGGEALCCRTKCEAGNRLISIDARGDVYPCHMLHKQELKLGNALEEELKDIVFSERNIFLKLDVDSFEGCGECEYKYLCGGGCRGRSYLRHLKLNQKDAYCAMIYDYYKDLMVNVKRSIGVM